MNHQEIDLQALAADYTAEAVPPCPVCGEALGIVQIGGGRPTVWACSSDTPDRDHYMRSRFEQRRGGDSRVVELIRRYRELESRLAQDCG